MPAPAALFFPQQPRASAHLARAVAAQRLHHAWLLVGGEEGSARAFGAALQAALLCNAQPQALAPPCGLCPSCRARRGDHHPDAIALKPNERGHISIEQVRAATLRLALSHQAAHRKVVWIWAADRLVPAAQNALLKSLEEPNPGTLFFLSAQRPGALLPTVRSRCLALHLAAAPATEQDEPTSPHTIAEPGAKAAAAAEPDGDAAATIAAGLAELGQPVANLQLRWPNILARASEWGRDPAQAAEACLAIERRVRDALAWHLGAAPAPAPKVAPSTSPATPTPRGPSAAATSPSAAQPTLAQASDCAELIAWGRARNTMAQQRSWHLFRLLATLFGPPSSTSWRDP